MLEVEGYTIDKCLRSSVRSEVYTAVRDCDGREVVVKTYRKDTVDSAGATRAQREHDVTRKVEGRGVRRALEVVSSGTRTALVLDRVAGVSLDRLCAGSPLAPRVFLEVAVQLADILVRVHAARLIHRDIKPSNVLVDPATHEVHLIDFGLARSLGTMAPSGEARSATALVDDSLRYMAPEQSGRMARGIDSRSDLYSLGATLYFALTGRPPFEGSDPLVLIHAHIARVPEAPAELSDDVPPVLSDLVLKLLRKEPEERYQSALSLRADLSGCLDQLRTSGSLDRGLALGSSDVPERPLFPERLYGREEQVERVRAAYDRVASGATELVLVSGPAGAGKSALIGALRAPLVRSGGHLAQGKLDHYRRDQPYAAFVDALNSLIDQWMSEDDDRLAARKSELREALGGVGGVIVELVPDMQLVLGDVAPPPALGAKEAQLRLVLAVARLVASIASKAHPLALCIDDLQWADPGTLHLLEALLTEGAAEALLVVGTVRDPDPDLGPVRDLVARLRGRDVVVTECEVGPLTPEASRSLLAGALCRDLADVEWVADCVMRKTGAIPLLMRSFVELMHDRGALVYEAPTGWIWDEAGFEEARIPDDAVALVAQRMDTLAPDVREVLAFASCIGDTFDLDRLAQVSNFSPSEIEASLYALCDAGLLVPCRMGLRFSHDRIREAAQSLLTGPERARIHYDTGLLRLSRTPEAAIEERAQEIADHLNRAVDLLSDAERARLVGLNLVAGRRTMAAGSAASGDHYLRAGLALVRDDDWVDRFEQTFALLLEGARAAIFLGESARATELLDRLEPRAASVTSWSEVAATRVAASFGVLSELEVAELVRGYLRTLGLRWPLRPSLLRVYWSIVAGDWALRRARDGAPDAFDWNTSPPELLLARIRLITAGSGSFFGVSRRLALLAMSWRIRQGLRHGHLAAPGTELMSFGTYSFYIWPRASVLRRYLDLGTRWNEHLDDPRSALRAKHVLHGMAWPWLMSRRAAAAPLREAANGAAELGEREIRFYMLAMYTQIRVHSGTPLAEVERDHAELGIIGARSVALIRLLRERNPELDGLARELEALRTAPVPLQRMARSVAMLVLYTLGHAEAVLELMPEARDRRESEQAAGLPPTADITLLAGLAAARLAIGARGSRRIIYVRAIRRAHRATRGWARNGPDFVHMALLLEAERAAVRGRWQVAAAIHARAAQRAEAQGYVHHAAFAHELRAGALAHLRRDTHAQAAIHEALRCYKAWGANAKLAQLAASAGSG